MNKNTTREMKLEIVAFSRKTSVSIAATKYQTSPNNVYAWRAGHNLENVGAQSGQRQPSFTEETKRSVSEYYSNHTAYQTAARYGCSVQSIQKWRRKFGFPNKIAGKWPKNSLKDSPSNLSANIWWRVDGVRYATKFSMLASIKSRSRVFEIRELKVKVRETYTVECT